MRVAGPVLMALSLTLGGCGLPGPRSTPDLLATEVLSGGYIDAPVPSLTLSAPALLEPSDDMQAFARRYGGEGRSRVRTLRDLLGGMRDAGYLQAQYAAQRTLTPVDVFEQRRGNCLSYTMMFVVLARSAGLEARFQLVDVPPQWNQREDWVVLDQHVNSVVEDVRVDSNHTRDMVVDFNLADYQGSFARRTITDAEAFARYFSNLGVEAMIDGNHGLALAYLREALRNDPGLSAAWVNVGVLHASQGADDIARFAYEQALLADARDLSAMSNLATLLERAGDRVQAQRFRDRIAWYRQRNPYYHYSESLSALDTGDLQAARRHLSRALRLKGDEHQFHFLKARLAAASGDAQQTRQSLRAALDRARGGSVRRRYEGKLEQLQAAAAEG